MAVRVPWQIVAFVLIAAAAIFIATCQVARGDLAGNFAELNAQRAAQGWPPLRFNQQLAEWAQKKAEWQAAYQVDPVFDGRGNIVPGSWNGHEGPKNPWHFVEGTGVNGSRFATCAMNARGNYEAGVGVAVNADTGKRFCCTLINAARINEYGGAPELIETQQLNPAAPVIASRDSRHITREPSRRAYTPINHPFLDVHEAAAKRAQIVLVSTRPPLPIDLPLPYVAKPKAKPAAVVAAKPAAVAAVTYPPSTPDTVTFFTIAGCAPCSLFRRNDKPILERDGVKVVTVYQSQIPAGLQSRVKKFPSFMVSGDPEIYVGYQTAGRLKQRLAAAKARRRT